MPAGEAPGTAALRVVARHGRSLVFLDWADVWAFEASKRQTFVHARPGRFELDVRLTAIEARFKGRLVRVHRNWLVNLESVHRMSRTEGETRLHLGVEVGAERLCVPVSRASAKAVRELLIGDAVGVRR